MVMAENDEAYGRAAAAGPWGWSVAGRLGAVGLALAILWLAVLWALA